LLTLTFIDLKLVYAWKNLRKKYASVAAASLSSPNGALAVLTSIAARNTIDSGNPVKIGDLTTLKPGAVKV
jgi:hypothetical protein